MADLDRAKVIKGLHYCLRGSIQEHENCPYVKECDKAIALNAEKCPLLDDLLEILREQEPVKPNTSCDGLPGEGGTWWYVCGNCSNDIDPDDAYCRHCGRKVLWGA